MRIGKIKPSLWHGMRRIENDYYAERADQARELPKPRSIPGRNDNKRNRATHSRQVIANLRWAHEREAWSKKQLAEVFGYSLGSVDAICNYITWTDVEASPEGFDWIAFKRIES